MDRTIPSFRIALAREEKDNWKPVCNALGKSDRKRSFFEGIFVLAKFYISAYFISVE
jgi:hypothetical protein